MPQFLSFQVGSSGALSLVGTYPVGVAPNALASDPTSKFLYVTDGAANQMIGFLVQINGALINVQTPFKTDNLPDAVEVDPRAIYVYVANYNANDVSAYAMDNGPLEMPRRFPARPRMELTPARAEHPDRTCGGPLRLYGELPGQYGIGSRPEPR